MRTSIDVLGRARPGTGSAPREEIEHPELQEERHIAGSPHAVAAGAAMLALTRAARSFTLYDPANKVVRALIADYRDRFRAVLEGHGPLLLEVHPFELTLGREVVYLERDRERSLAFRLFRDGVRRLSFMAGTSWDELLRLLQILSIRYTGVRQQEDDLVTLLRKAGFESVQMAAIEGFVPEEEHQESPLDPGLLRGARERYDPPPQWDTPLPPFPEAAPLVYRPVTEGLLARLRAEEAEDAGAGPGPARGLRAAAGPGPGRPSRRARIRPGGARVPAGRSARRPDRGARRTRAQLARRCDRCQRRVPRGLARPAHARGARRGAAPGRERAGAPLAELLDAAPATVVDRLFDLLAAEGDGPRAPLLRAAAGAGLPACAAGARDAAARGAGRGRRGSLPPARDGRSAGRAP